MSRLFHQTLVFALVLLGAMPSAQAQWELRWTRGEGAADCIDEARLERSVIEERGMDPFGEPHERRVVGSIERLDDGRFQILIVVLDADGGELGRRSLAARTTGCEAVDAAVVVLVATSVASLPSTTSERPSSPPPSPAPDASVARVTEPPHTPADASPPASEVEAPPDPPQVSVDMHAGATFALDMLPGFALGPQIGATMRPPGIFGFAVDAAFWSHGDESVGEGNIRLSLLEGVLGVCPELEFERVWLSLCAQAVIGWLRAEGSGYATNEKSDAVYLAAQALSRARILVTSRFWVGIDLGVRIPLIRDTFYIEESTGARSTEYQLAPVSPVAGVHVGVAL